MDLFAETKEICYTNPPKFTDLPTYLSSKSLQTPTPFFQKGILFQEISRDKHDEFRQMLFTLRWVPQAIFLAQLSQSINPSPTLHGNVGPLGIRARTMAKDPWCPSEHKCPGDNEKHSRLS